VQSCSANSGQTRPFFSSAAVGEQPQRRLCGNQLAEEPGARLEIRLAGVLGVVPVLVPEEVEAAELEGQPGMSGGDQVVVDIHAGGADMAVDAEAGIATSQRPRVVLALRFAPGPASARSGSALQASAARGRGMPRS